MVLSFVCINVEIGTEKEVIEELNKIPEIDSVYQLYGVYDIIAKIKTDTMANLKNIIQEKIRKKEKVKETLTMIVHKD